MNAKKSNLHSYWKYAFTAPLLLAMLVLINKPIPAFAGEVSESATFSGVSKVNRVIPTIASRYSGQ